MLEGFGDVRMTAVGIGGIEEAQAVVVSVAEEIRESFNTEGGLMRMMARAHRSRAHGEAAGFDAGAAQTDCIGRGELLAEGLISECAKDRFAREPGCSSGRGGTDEEFATTHEVLPVRLASI